MENKRNFYAQYSEIYNNVEKKEVRCKLVITKRKTLPFPYMPFTDEIENSFMQKMLVDISNNDELFFIGTNAVNKEEAVNGMFNKVGAVCKMECVNVKDNGINYICNVLYFAEIKHVEPQNGVVVVDVEPLNEVNAKTENSLLLLERVKELYFNYINYINRKVSQDLLGYIKESVNPNVAVSLIAVTINLTFEEQYKLQCETDTEKRLEDLIVRINKLFSFEALDKKINERIKVENEKRQKEIYIKEKIKYLNEEINEQDEFSELENKIKRLDMPEDVRETVLKSLTKLSKTPSMAADYSVLRNYIDTIIELPWEIETVDNTSIEHAKEILNNEHYGLEKVKQRILEYLAVLNLKGKVGGQILCLVGAPGVGKTSIAKSVANALGRKFVKLSLGGIHDETEIRGHRRTYVASMPGKIIYNIKNAGSVNPVFLLDEIDKITTDIHGDPASALLEVLDPAQNNNFRDNFLEIPFDLSKVIFIATANYANRIPAPLYDRMEIINIDSYLAPEKLEIAKNYLLKRELVANGLSENAIQISDETIMAIINNYTFEAGVRNLERLIAKICRKLAVMLVEDKNTKLPWNVTSNMLPDIFNEAPIINRGVRKNSEVGIGYGLSWSSCGGSILTLEGVVLKGDGKIEITGNLKDVMKESCKIALSVAKRQIEKDNNLVTNNIDYSKIDIHVNACEGAIEKDGPSAGTVLSLVIYSALTNKPINNNFAITGEISLTGYVTAVGGLKEKLYACVTNNIKNVIVPLENKKDIELLNKDITDKLNINYVSNFSEVVKLAILNEDK